LMSTSEYKPDPAYHFMNHPTTAGLYMVSAAYPLQNRLTCQHTC
jgi:xylulokinase